MILETERLILRKPRLSDWKDIVEGIGNLEVSKYLATVPYPYTKNDAIGWINKQVKNWRKREKESYSFVIELKSQKKVIGGTSINKIDKFNGKATTGSWINKKYWRNGYITEAKIPILDFAFNQLKLRKLETAAFIGNKASNSMSVKLGFKYEGTKRKTIVSKANGKIYDENIYGLLKSEWKKSRPKLIRGLKRKIK